MPSDKGMVKTAWLCCKIRCCGMLRHLFLYFRCSSRSFWCLRNRWPKHAAFFHACCITFTAGLQTTFPEPIISTHSSLNQVNKQEEQVGNLELWEPCAASTLTSAPLSPAWNGLRKQIPPFFLMKQNSIPACLADVSFNGAVVEALRKQHVQSCYIHAYVKQSSALVGSPIIIIIQ